VLNFSVIVSPSLLEKSLILYAAPHDGQISGVYFTGYFMQKISY
jgi:hypothetical protein